MEDVFKTHFSTNDALPINENDFVSMTQPSKFKRSNFCSITVLKSLTRWYVIKKKKERTTVRDIALLPIQVCFVVN